MADLDDLLDSALDDYDQEVRTTAPPVVASAPVPAALPPTPSYPFASAPADAALEAEILRDPSKFAADLQTIMAELGSVGSGDPAIEDPMMKTMQQLIAGLQSLPAFDGPLPAGAAPAFPRSSVPASSAAAPAASSATPVAGFDQLLDQMTRAVSDGAKAATSAAAPAAAGAGVGLPGLGDMAPDKLDEMFKAMFASMGNPDFNPADFDPNNKDSMDKMMEMMMTQANQLINKSTLIAPITSIAEKV